MFGGLSMQGFLPEKINKVFFSKESLLTHFNIDSIMFSFLRPARGIAQSGSAPALGAGCRGFKSLYPDSEARKRDDASLRGDFLFEFDFQLKLDPQAWLRDYN